MRRSVLNARKIILEKIQDFKQCGKMCLICVDGNSGAGKSTFAAELSRVAGAALFHMDDFFLPPKLRTAARLSEPGGNIDYERFNTEVIQGIRSGKPFTYHIFSCSDNTYTPKTAMNQPINIIEGVYSTHPLWQTQIDIKIFLTVSPEIQELRILRRNGADMLQNFTGKWIPMENHYFDFYKIPHVCDYIIDTDLFDI